MLTLEKIYKASEVLKEVAGKTDILPASKIFCDNHIFLKTENIQSTGSFKVRGAYFKISELTEEEKNIAALLGLNVEHHIFDFVKNPRAAYPLYCPGIKYILYTFKDS